MLRNLVVPAVFIATAVLTGCQSMQETKPPPPETTREQVPEADLPELIRQPQPPAPKPVENIITIKEQIIQTPAHLDGRLLLGFQEEATLPDLNIAITAKLDTGAASTSIDARDIQLFERDGKKWVKFNLYRTSEGKKPMELPVKEVIKIRRPGLKALERPVVSLTIAIGELTQQVLVTLTDRSKFEYPLLVGRNFIRDLAVIDVNQKHIAEKSLIDTRSLKVNAPEGKTSYTKTIKKPVSVYGLATLGEIETVTLPGPGLTLKARIDTGAKTSSLDARELEVFKKGKKYRVRFKIPYEDNLIPVEYPVTRFLLIKRHGVESERRPVITIKAKIGKLTRPTQFSLRNRKGYEFPVLIGERFLKDTAVVDVSQKFISGTAQRGSE